MNLEAEKPLVFIVDHVKEDRERMMRKINDIGCLAFPIMDGEDPLEKIEGLSHLDIAIINIGFPGKPSGDEIIEAFRDRYPKVHRIIISHDITRAAYVMRANDHFLPNPLDAEIISLIKSLPSQARELSL